MESSRGAASDPASEILSGRILEPDNEDCDRVKEAVLIEPSPLLSTLQKCRDVSFSELRQKQKRELARPSQSVVLTHGAV